MRPIQKSISPAIKNHCATDIVKSDLKANTAAEAKTLVPKNQAAPPDLSALKGVAASFSEDNAMSGKGNALDVRMSSSSFSSSSNLLVSGRDVTIYSKHFVVDNQRFDLTPSGSGFLSDRLPYQLFDTVESAARATVRQWPILTETSEFAGHQIETVDGSELATYPLHVAIDDVKHAVFLEPIATGRGNDTGMPRKIFGTKALPGKEFFSLNDLATALIREGRADKVMSFKFEGREVDIGKDSVKIDGHNLGVSFQENAGWYFDGLPYQTFATLTDLAKSTINYEVHGTTNLDPQTRPHSINVGGREIALNDDHFYVDNGRHDLEKSGDGFLSASLPYQKFDSVEDAARAYVSQWPLKTSEGEHAGRKLKMVDGSDLATYPLRVEIDGIKHAARVEIVPNDGIPLKKTAFTSTLLPQQQFDTLFELGRALIDTDKADKAQSFSYKGRDVTIDTNSVSVDGKDLETSFIANAGWYFTGLPYQVFPSLESVAKAALDNPISIRE